VLDPDTACQRIEEIGVTIDQLPTEGLRELVALIERQREESTSPAVRACLDGLLETWGPSVEAA
jgi:hypothetical protein